MPGIIAMIASGGGFNPLDFSTISNAFWTWVIFLISLYFMTKFVFGPIVRALDIRDGQALQAISDAKQARDEASAIKDEIDKRLDQVKEEELEMLATARTKAEALGREIQEKAKLDGEKQLERTRTAISQEKAAALAEIRSEVVDLTIMAAGKVVGRAVSEADHRTFVEDLMSGSTPGKDN